MYIVYSTLAKVEVDIEVQALKEVIKNVRKNSCEYLGSGYCDYLEVPSNLSELDDSINLSGNTRCRG